jgi:hypothetical protein
VLTQVDENDLDRRVVLLAHVKTSSWFSSIANTTTTKRDIILRILGCDARIHPFYKGATQILRIIKSGG